MNFFDIEFLSKDFWNEHGIFFLVFITLFPRLTLLFSDIAFGGVFWWLSWAFAPRILVAVLATISYWNNHPILVLISWLVALGGESGEKHFIRTKTVSVKVEKPNFYKDSSEKDTIEAEFERKS